MIFRNLLSFHGLIKLSILCILSPTHIAIDDNNFKLADLPLIYGVRWCLGEKFSLSTSQSDNNLPAYVLIFNTLKPLPNPPSVLIDGESNGDMDHQQLTRYTCTQRKISTDAVQGGHHQKQETISGKVQTVIYKCFIDEIDFQNEVNYQIQSIRYIEHNSQPNLSKRNPTIKTLFSAKFRPISKIKQMEMIAIGDWGVISNIGKSKGYNQVLPCLITTLERSPNIRLLLFMGDLAYDFTSLNYHHMLIHMQPLSSTICFLLTPGNHDTIYHSDAFQMFEQSWRGMNWQKYGGFFSLGKVGNLVFLGYNPQKYSASPQSHSGKINRFHEELIDIFSKEIPKSMTEFLRQSTVIVYSHYPIICSNPSDSMNSCKQNPKRLASYRQYFNEIGVEIYLSGHLHVYERSKWICQNGTTFENREGFEDVSCSIYIVEGAGGNNFYVQTQKLYQPSQNSSFLSYNTGFGIMKIGTSSLLSSQQPFKPNITYHHFDAGSCSRIDTFSSIHKPQTNELPQVLQSYLLIIKISIISFIIIGTPLLLYAFQNKRHLHQNTKTERKVIRASTGTTGDQPGHVQIVEEDVHTEQEQKLGSDLFK